MAHTTIAVFVLLAITGNNLLLMFEAQQLHVGEYSISLFNYNWLPH